MHWNLIHKYLTGQCNSVERMQVISWIEKDLRNEEFMNSIQKIWNVTPQHSVKVNAKEAWKRFEAQHLASSKEQYLGSEFVDNSNHIKMYRIPEHHNKRRRKRAYLRFSVKTVATAAVFLFAVLFYQQIPKTVLETENKRVDQQIETEYGQRTTVSLSEGSQIVLNSASKLTIPAGFPENLREVYLEGEAYFDVQSDNSKPFIVNSKHTYTKVLGTKFGVRAYADEDRSQAIVEEGKVIVGFRNRPKEKQEVLRKNDLAILTHEGSTEVKQAKYIKKYLGWKNGLLYFKDTPFREVERQLERWFALHVEVEDSTMYDKVLTATFNDEPLSEVLNVVALSLQGTFSRDGRDIIFKNKQ